MSDEKSIKQLVESRHPEYEDNLAHWNFLEETYEGGREWFVPNLFRFIKEGDKEYEERVKRAYRFNHTKQVVDQVDKYLFKMPVARKSEDAPDAIKDFWKNATLSGLDADTFAKRISNQTSQYGRVYIVVDSTAVAGSIVSIKDEKKANQKIYAYIVRPQDMLDMSYDDLGRLNWCLVREYARDDSNPMDSSRAMVERFRLWTRKGWTLYQTVMKRGKKTYIEVADDTHDLKVVPVIQADHVFSEEQYGSSGLIDDVAYLDRAVANYLSNLDAVIQDQTFSQLVMPAQGVLPGELGYDKLIDMSTKRVFLYNGEGGGTPSYIAPDPKQAQLILTAISSIVKEIYHSVGLSGERTQSNSGGNDSEASGVAKSYDFERVNSLLSAKAAALQLTEEKIASLVCLYAGKPAGETDKLLEYPKEFDVRSVYDEFEIAEQLMTLAAPDEVRREQMRSLIKKLFPAAPDAVVTLLEGSLKSWPPEILVDAGGLGAPKLPGTSSGNTSKPAKKLATKA